MKNQNIVFSPAKINLQLAVGEVKNGYHELYTVMQTVSLFDTLIFNIKKSKLNKINPDKQIHISCNKKFIPTDSRNLCFKAIKYFIERYNILDEINLYIKKAIPTGGGLAGGSGNFYYVIKFLNDFYNKKLNINEIQEICNKYGSDISFFTIGGTCLCTGRGEIIKKIENFPSSFILIVNNYMHSSTKETYEEYDKTIHIDNNDKKEKFMLELNGNKDINILCKNLFNDLEDIVIKKIPEINEIKEILIKNNAINALMSGSGSSVYGIFKTYEEAKNAKDVLKKSYKIFTNICKPI